MRIHSRFLASTDYKLVREERKREREVKPRGRGWYTGKNLIDTGTKRQGRGLGGVERRHSGTKKDRVK